MTLHRSVSFWIILCSFALIFLSTVDGAPRPLQLPLDDEYSGQAVGMGLSTLPEAPVLAWKRAVPETNNYMTDDALVIPAPISLREMLFSSGRKYKRQAPTEEDAPDAPVDPSPVTTPSTADEPEANTGSTENSVTQGNSAIVTTKAGPEEDEQLGNQTMEDLQELESFYNQAREQILRTHNTRLDVENLKNGKTTASKSKVSDDESDNMADESSN